MHRRFIGLQSPSPLACLAQTSRASGEYKWDTGVKGLPFPWSFEVITLSRPSKNTSEQRTIASRSGIQNRRLACTQKKHPMHHEIIPIRDGMNYTQKQLFCDGITLSKLHVLWLQSSQAWWWLFRRDVYDRTSLMRPRSWKKRMPATSPEFYTMSLHWASLKYLPSPRSDMYIGQAFDR